MSSTSASTPANGTSSLHEGPLLPAGPVSQHGRRDRQGGEPHKRQHTAEERASEEHKGECQSATYGQVQQRDHDRALRLLLR